MALVTIVANETALGIEGATQVARIIAQSIAARGSAFVALSGGHTPRTLYTRLADPDAPWLVQIDWKRVHLFWSDERHVPPDSDESNYRLANETLIQRVPIPVDQVHRVQGEMPDAAGAATAYQDELQTAFRDAQHPGAFDLVLLGLGEDAHIASLFPGSPVLGETRLQVAAPWVPHLRAFRITLTPPTLLDALAIVVLTAGSAKAPAVAAALEAPEDVARWPAQLLRTAGDRVEWIVDCAAAADLRQTETTTR